MIHRHITLGAKVLALGVAGLAVCAGLILWMMTVSPIAIPGIKSYLEADMTAARGGRPVKVSGVELAWPKRGLMQLRARGVRVLDSQGHELTHSDNMVIGLSFHALLEGHVRITDALINGGDLTITNRADGATTVAFGPPGATPDIVLPPSPKTSSVREQVGRLLDGLRATLKPVGPGGRLNTLSVRGARLTVVDEASGGRWTGADAAFDLKRAQRTLMIHAGASLNGPQGPAPFGVDLTTNTAFDAATVSLTVNGARPQALGPFAPHGIMEGLSAPVTLAVNAAIDRQQGLTQLKGDLSLGRGTLDYGGGKLELDGGKVSGVYDVAQDALLVREVSLAGAKTKMTGEARLMHASALFTDKPTQLATFQVASPVITFDMPGAFAGPVTLTKLMMAGTVQGATVRFDKFDADLDTAHLNLKGDVYWADDGRGVLRPGVRAVGGIDGALSSKALLTVWPLHAADTTRAWLGDDLLDGRMYDVTINADIKPADGAKAEADGMRDSALSVKFKYDRASVRYVDQMLPVTAAFGDAELKGNSFTVALDHGMVGDLVVTNGKVLLPRLYPKGALATYAGHVDGDARSMVNLLRMAPIGLDARLPFTPATITGRGAVDFSIQRPLGSGYPDSALLFKVDGKLDSAGGQAKNGAYTISQWRLHVSGDQDALTFAGPLVVGKTSRADLTWNEKLRGNSISPSTINFKGRVDALDLVSLGFPVFDYARGPVGVDFKAVGKGQDVNTGQGSLDFREASITLPKGFWIKPVGQASTIKFDLARQRDKSLMLNNIVAGGQGMSGTATAHVAESGDLLEASSPRIVLNGALDGRVSAKRVAGQLLLVNVTGPFLSIGPFFAPDPALSDPSAPGMGIKPGKLSPAFEIDAMTTRVRMRADADVTNATVVAGSDGKALTKFALNGADPGGKPFKLEINPVAGQPVGRLIMRAQDAGFAVRAITSQTNVKGGKAEADGSWRFAENPSAQIQVRMHDFRLIKVPAMASLLQSVGSLTGMVDMLNNDGIQFTAFEAPVTMANNQVTLGDCRASGPAVGLTAKGGVNLNDGNVAIDGVIVPSFGVNSFLGGMPLLGNLWVSRKGEGVFGITFTMKGPADKPSVGVNPLSALTPGIFRRIFEPIPKSKPAG